MTHHTADALGLLLADRASVFDYARDFNALWKMANFHAHIVVVWGDTPPDPTVHPVATETHLTPFDWAIVARVATKTIEITVVDLKKNHRDNHAAVRWFLTQREGCVPWLRRVTAGELAAATNPGAVVTLLTGAIDARNPQVPPFEVLRSLPICREDRSATANHHAVANLIGPMLLNIEAPPALNPDHRGADHRAAVQRLLTEAGLLRAKAPRDSEEAKKRARDLTEATNRVHEHARRFQNVLLVDDMADLGWAEFAGKFWPKSLTVQKSPDDVIKAIKARYAPANADGKAFELEQFDLILLDLRLTNSKSAAERLLRDLNALVPSVPRLWNGIAPAQDAADAKGLTLLPRLLANAFPDVPIILFSTTLRRDMVEQLHGFDNIITEFGKPRLGEEDGALRALDGFGRALGSAFAVRRAGELVASLVSAGNGAPNRIGAGAKIVDILLDESGKFDAGDVSVIAGVLFEYDDPETAEHIASDLDKFNLVWGLSRDILDHLRKPKVNAMNGAVLGKQMLPAVQESRLKEMTKYVFQNATVRAIGIVLPRTQTAKPADSFADAEFRQYLGILLEVLIADLVDPTATIHIDVATRLREVPDKTERERQWHHFGRKKAHGETIYALSPEEVHPITDNIAWRRGVRPPPIARASTIDNRFLWQLSDDARNGCFFQLEKEVPRPQVNPRGVHQPESQAQLRDTSKAHPRQVHYLADWVATAGRNVARAEGPAVPTIEGWYSSGFLVQGDATLDKMLAGLRSGSLKPSVRSPDRIAEAVQLCGEAVEAWRAAPGRFPMLVHLAVPLAGIASAAGEPAVRKALRKRVARLLEGEAAVLPVAGG